MTEVDFIVPVCNGSGTIERCLDSILRCPLSHCVFVVENGSTDHTPDIIARVAARSGGRIRWTSVPYRSKARAANFALLQGAAPVVWCVDADVVFEHDRFGLCRRALESFDCLLLTPTEVCDRPEKVDFDRKFSAARDSFLIRRSIIGDRLFSPWYSHCGAEDLDLVIRLLKRGLKVGRTWGGFTHLRMGRRMGFRRRLHFVIWNTFTYLRHLDCAYCRARVGQQLFTWPIRLWKGLSEELGCDPVDPP